MSPAPGSARAIAGGMLGEMEKVLICQGHFHKPWPPIQHAASERGSVCERVPNFFVEKLQKLHTDMRGLYGGTVVAVLKPAIPMGIIGSARAPRRGARNNAFCPSRCPASGLNKAEVSSPVQP